MPNSSRKNVVRSGEWDADCTSLELIVVEEEIDMKRLSSTKLDFRMFIVALNLLRTNNKLSKV